MTDANNDQAAKLQNQVDAVETAVEEFVQVQLREQIRALESLLEKKQNLLSKLTGQCTDLLISIRERDETIKGYRELVAVLNRTIALHDDNGEKYEKVIAHLEGKIVELEAQVTGKKNE